MKPLLRLILFLGLTLAPGCRKKEPAPAEVRTSPGLRVKVSPGVDLKGKVPKATPVADLATLPGLPTGGRPVAAGVFEPAGLECEEGLEVTWPLAEARPPGAMLPIQALEDGQWFPTGWIATVGVSGREATGTVHHFSTLGVFDDTGCLIDWVWILSVYEPALDKLARAVSEKYRDVLKIPKERYLNVEQWLATGTNVVLPRSEGCL